MRCRSALELQRLHVVGLSHRTAPLDVRSRAALAGHRGVLAMRRALALGASEAVVVATCNRTELYVAGAAEARWAAAATLYEVTDLGRDDCAAHCYQLSGRDALAHLLRVAASLESMNVGEPDIQGQLRRAVRDAEAAGALGPTLRTGFRHAGAVGKRVRRLTGIGRGAVSLPSLIVETARDELRDLEGTTALLIGAGHMAGSVARALAGQLSAELVVLNRSRDAARRLARAVGASDAPFTALGDGLRRADVVVCCTASREPFVDRGLLAPATRGRPRPLVLIDLAVPPDVSPECEQLSEVRVHRLESLLTRATRNRGERGLEARRAEVIVAEFLERVVEGHREAMSSAA